MKCIQDIYEAIENGGFTASTLQLIDEFVNDIENGSTDPPRFNQQEHSGLCKAGSALIGASVIASYAAGSLTAGGHAGSGQNVPSNWEIDELQEKKEIVAMWNGNNGDPTIVEKVVEKVTENQKAIMLEIKKNPFVTASGLSEILGISLRKTQDNMRKLREAGLIRRISPDKGGHWEVVEE